MLSPFGASSSAVQANARRRCRVSAARSVAKLKDSSMTTHLDENDQPGRTRNQNPLRGALRLWLLVGLVSSGLVGVESITTADDAPVAINLLDKLNPREQAVAGQWTLADDGLTVAAANGARIRLPWTPTAEYDFEVEFTRHDGENSIALIFAAGGQQAAYDIDGWGQHLAGIQNIDGKTMRENPTRVADIALTNGRKYTAAVRVRRDRVEALLDGKVLTTYRGNGSDLSLLELWALRQPVGLGLGAWNSRTTFHAVRVTPLAGSPLMTAARTTTSPAATPSSTPATPSTNPATPPARSTGTVATTSRSDISGLSDEFDDPTTLSRWQRVFQAEQTRADQLSVIDIGRTRRGRLTLIPHTSTWYQDYRGVLVYKLVEGDFVVTTLLQTSNRAGTGAPRSPYSLAGLMIRTPRDVTPRTWQPGGENYIFLSHGSARSPGRFEFEVKTTVNSRSDLEVTPAQNAEVIIQVARVGSDFVLLRKDGDRPWEVHRRYRRADMPAELQVGLTVYTDYNTASRLPPLQQNTQVIRTGNPDLRASFEFVRFRRPQLPSDVAGRSIADPAQVPDAVLLQFLGDHALTSP